MAFAKDKDAHFLLEIFFVIVSILLTSSLTTSHTLESAEMKALMEIKASLDPDEMFLYSWTGNGDPCSVKEFEGVACNEVGRVVNISLQGKGLYGSISPAVAELTFLTGLFLHYNDLSGEIPKEIGYLTQLSELYLNVNSLSGRIPVEIGGMVNLQVLQLSHNKLNGSIPTEMGSMKKLDVLALQCNLISGTIPESLGELPQIERLDLSFNRLNGTIPTKLAQLPQLVILDVTNNSLSGPVPSELRNLEGGFRYGNNSDLCGTSFPSLRICASVNPTNTGSKPEAYRTDVSEQKSIPQSANVVANCTDPNCPSTSKSSKIHAIVAVVATSFVVTALVLSVFAWRHRKPKRDKTLKATDVMLNCEQVKNAHRKSWSPLISLEYSKGWDPLADGKTITGFSQEESQSLRFNVEEVEFATQNFSDINLLGRSNFSATYKGILRDGSGVAVKCISKISCKSEEAKFLKGLKVLTSLSHENLLGLRGFCCSKARGECFLIYDLVANGSLSRYLDARGNPSHGCRTTLDWHRRVSIIKGIARGLEYLHSSRPNKPPLVHENLSANNILIDHHFKPLIAGSGLHKLLADDVVFSALKASAAMGYLAPEYASTGQFTEKSDIYAFGMIVLQVVSGMQGASHFRIDVQQFAVDEIIDRNLHGNFSEVEAARLVSITLACTSESPSQRPSIQDVLQELCAQ